MVLSSKTQRQVTADLGDAAIVSIRPRAVAYHAGSKWPVAKGRIAKLERVLPRKLVRPLRPAFKKREPFVTPAGYHEAPRAMTDTPLYQKISDFVHRTGDVEDTMWCRELVAELNMKGTVYHKQLAMRSLEDIRGFFKFYVTPLINSLRRDGFRPDMTGYESAAVIDAEGTLLKTGSGNHRFAMAFATDLETFPLRVVAAHEAWYAREVLPYGDTRNSFLASLKKVEARHLTSTG